MLDLPAVPPPRPDPPSVFACLTTVKEAIETIAKQAVSRDDLVRLGVASPAALASGTGTAAGLQDVSSVTRQFVLTTLSVLDGGTF